MIGLTPTRSNAIDIPQQDAESNQHVDGSAIVLKNNGKLQSNVMILLFFDIIVMLMY